MVTIRPEDELAPEVNNWSKKPAETAVEMQLCPASLGQGNQFANCFSFACTIDKKLTNGVKTATCTCPLGENPDGSAVSANTAFVTPAGQCNEDVCSEHPVGAADTAPNQATLSYECLTNSSSSSTSATGLMAQ